MSWMIAGMDDFLALRPAAEDDLALLERLTQDPGAAGEFTWTGWRDLPRFRQGWEEDRLVRDDGGVLMIVRKDERIGFVSWFKVDFPPAYCWNMGIELLPEARGQGYGTQAHRLLARYLFAHTTVHRVEAATEAGNVAEQRALEKAGFTREGVMRGVFWRDGAWRDGVLYSLLRTDQRA
jgi:RimJ/RimL family protein N-acetyltransferase